MPKAKPPSAATPEEPPSGAELVDQLVAQFAPILARGSWSGKSPADVPAGRTLLAADAATRGAAFGTVLDRLKDWYGEYTAFEASRGPRETPARRREKDALFDRRCLLMDTLIHLRRPPRPHLTDRTASKFVEWHLREMRSFGTHDCHIEAVWDVIRPHAAADGIGPHLRKAIGRLVPRLRKTGFVIELKYADKFEELLAGGGRRK
jgi:hypothetical protein